MPLFVPPKIKKLNIGNYLDFPYIQTKIKVHCKVYFVTAELYHIFAVNKIYIKFLASFVLFLEKNKEFICVLLRVVMNRCKLI